MNYADSEKTYDEIEHFYETDETEKLSAESYISLTNLMTHTIRAKSFLIRTRSLGGISSILTRAND